MKKSSFILIVIIIFLSLAVAGCNNVKSVEVAAAEETIAPTPTPTPKKTPEPTPTPTPEPTPDPGIYGDGAYIIESFDNEIPSIINQNFKYDKQDTWLNYVVALKDGFIYDTPSIYGKQIIDIDYGDRLETTAVVEMDNYIGGVWYRVHYKDKEENEFFGYVHNRIVELRTYQIDKAYNDTVLLQQEIDDEDSVYVNVVNRANAKGLAPDSGLKDEFGKVVDKFGTLQDQSAPAFKDASLDSDFRYILDGTLVKVIRRVDDFIEVYIPQYDENYFVPKDYLKYYSSDPKSTIEKVSEAIVIDRTNQNIMYFEKNIETDEWELLTMSYVSTGTESVHADPTPVGFFMVQKVRIEFVYASDENDGIKAGYAPYVIRFSGGAYNHGVPLNYKIDELGNLVKPNTRESHPSLGVKPESHMCVRNYTSHAKFLYNRIDVGKAVVIVIE